MARDQGYVPLRRGLREHLKRMGPHAATLYVALLIDACPKAGPDAGTALMTVGDLAGGLGMSRTTICEALKKLAELEYIVYTPAINRWRDGSVKITKYKPTVGTSTRPPDSQLPGQVEGQLEGQLAGLPDQEAAEYQVSLGTGKGTLQPSDQPEGAPENVRERKRPGSLEPSTTGTSSAREVPKALIEAINKDLGVLVLGPMQYQTIGGWLDSWPVDVILAAVRDAAELGKRNIRYVDSILSGCKSDGVTDLDGYKARQQRHLDGKSGSTKGGTDAGKFSHLDKPISL